jgi:hypothetical protein
VYRYTGGLINDNEVVILVDDSYGKTCDRGFVAMGSVGDDLAVLNLGVGIGAHTVDLHQAVFKSASLFIVRLKILNFCIPFESRT